MSRQKKKVEYQSWGSPKQAGTSRTAVATAMKKNEEKVIIIHGQEYNKQVKNCCCMFQTVRTSFCAVVQVMNEPPTPQKYGWYHETVMVALLATT